MNHPTRLLAGAIVLCGGLALPAFPAGVALAAGATPSTTAPQTRADVGGACAPATAPTRTTTSTPPATVRRASSKNGAQPAGRGHGPRGGKRGGPRGAMGAPRGIAYLVKSVSGADIVATPISGPTACGTTGTRSSGGTAATSTSAVTITVASTTVIARAGTTVTESAIHAGERISVRGTRTGNTLAASMITIDLPHVRGFVESISGNTITLLIPVPPAGAVTPPVSTVGTITPNGKVVLSASTRYMNGGLTTTRNAITVGMAIDAQGTLTSNGTLEALLVRIGGRGGRGR